MNIKAIIFDLDGVITDTAHYHFKAWSKIATKFNYKLTQKDNESLKGLSRRRSLEKVLQFAGVSLSEEEIENLLIEKNEYYQVLLDDLKMTDTLIGVDAFLKDCKNNNLPIAIGSASKNTKRILTKLGLIDFFDAIVDGNMVKHSKPDPEVFLKGAKAINVDPAETIVFEDAIAGVKAANTGGFYSIGVGNAETLSHAKKVIANMDGLTIENLTDLVNQS